MDYFAGLDVSVKETSVCIVDDTGKIIRAAAHESVPGTNRTKSNVRYPVDIGGQADVVQRDQKWRD